MNITAPNGAIPFGRAHPSRLTPATARPEPRPLTRRLLLATAALIAAVSGSAQAETILYTGGAQTFTVATTGNYSFTIAGAKGGDGTFGSPSLTGGAGAILVGSFSLSAGQVLNLVAGGRGGSASGYGGGGGGGGSFVFNTTTGQLIAVAGGGGGAGSQSGGASGGQITTSGASGGGSGAGAGGVGGQGGQANPNDHGGGGGGFLSAGQNSSSATGGGGYPSLAGGTNPWGSYGGFGGGGASSYEGGGGGGYSGGGGGSGYLHYGGGGGGSFYAANFVLVSATAGSNGGVSSVTGNGGAGYIQFQLLTSSMGGGGTFLASSLGGSTLPAFEGGSLQIDAEGQTLAQNFTLGASGTNTIDQSGHEVTFSGVLSDATTAGAITIANGGSGGGVTFTGVNTYTGATSIGDGASLSLAGAGSVARSSGLNVEGVFDISGVSGGQADIRSLAGSGLVDLGAARLNITQAAGDFGGRFAGTGELSVSGGVQTLSGVSSLRATTVSGGILIVTGALTSAFTIGAGGGLQGDTSSLLAQGGVANAGTLVFDQTADGTFANPISGSGALVKQGAGVLVLSGASSAARTTVSGGSLVLAAPLTSTFAIGGGATLQGDTSSLLAQGAVTNDGTLVFDQAGQGVFSAPITGSGRLVKQNAGLLILNGVSQLGQSTVVAGNLQIGDHLHETALLTSAVQVGAGATLSGHGRIVGRVDNGAGTVSPGGSVGVLTIDGDYAQTAGGVLSIEVNPRESSQLVVTGVATLGGTLELLSVPGTYRAGTRYVLVSAGALAGDFDQVSLSNSLPFTVTTAGSTKVLTLSAGTFAAEGATRNQISAGTAFVNVALGHADFDGVADVLVNLPVAQQHAAFDSVGGEIAAQSARRGRAALRGFMGALSDQLFDESQDQGGRTAWGRVFAGSGSIDGDGDVHGVSSDAEGVALGGSIDLGATATLGAIFGHQQARFSLRGPPQSGEVKAYALGVYGERRMGVWFIDAAAGVGVSEGETRRTAAFGAVARVAEGGFNGTSMSGLVSAGARLRGRGGLVVEPSLSLVASRVTQDGFTETGAGDLNLVVAKRRDKALQAQLGVRAAKPFTLGDGAVLTLEGKAAWARELDDEAPSIRAAFLPAPANSFVLAAAQAGADTVRVGAGLTYAVSQRLAVYGRYDQARGGDGHDEQVTAGVRIAW